jgi:hypothetical protein
MQKAIALVGDGTMRAPYEKKLQAFKDKQSVRETVDERQSTSANSVLGQVLSARWALPSTQAAKPDRETAVDNAAN